MIATGPSMWSSSGHQWFCVQTAPPKAERLIPSDAASRTRFPLRLPLPRTGLARRRVPTRLVAHLRHRRHGLARRSWRRRCGSGGGVGVSQEEPAPTTRTSPLPLPLVGNECAAVRIRRAQLARRRRRPRDGGRDFPRLPGVCGLRRSAGAGRCCQCAVQVWEGCVAHYPSPLLLPLCGGRRAGTTRRR